MPASVKAPPVAVPPRMRQGFQINALFEVIWGLILMLNPLLGPKLFINGFLVSMIGFGFLIYTVFLGMAGLGKGLLKHALPTVAVVNIGVGLALLVAGVLSNVSSGGVTVLVALGVGLIALGVWELAIARRPAGKPKPRRATPAELQAALRGNHSKK